MNEEQRTKLMGVLEDALKRHDWYYQMSDSHSVWSLGQIESDLIKSLRQSLGYKETEELYKKYCPYGKRRKEKEE